MSISERTFYYWHPTDIVGANATVSVETGTEDDAYPAENAVDFGYANLAAPAKLEEVLGAWLFDFGGAQRIDGAIIWHNFLEGLACVLQGHTSDDWSSPTVEVPLDIQAKWADGFTRKVFVDLRDVEGYTASGLRYWRLAVTGANDVPIGVKVLLFSQIRELARDFEWGFETVDHKVGIDMTTDALHPWAYDLTAAPVAYVGAGVWSAADDLKIREWQKACGGRAKVTAVVLEPSTGEAEIVRWADGPAGVVNPSIVVQKSSSVDKFSDGKARRIVLEAISAGDPEWV